MTVRTIIRWTLTATSFLGLALTSCVREPSCAAPPSEHGRITLTTDWTARTAGLAVPRSYTACVGAYSAELSGERNALDYLFEPGVHGIRIYNPAEHISVRGSVATVAAAGGKAGGTLHAAPGWLFTHAGELAVEAGREHSYSAAMRQQVGRLTLAIEPVGANADRVVGIEGTLRGAAGTFDMESGRHGAASDVELSFVKDADGKYRAAVRLLGVAGPRQQLSARIRYAGDTPAPISLESDLTEALSGFNADKKTPLTLSAQAVETPSEVGFTAAIEGWKKIYGGEVVAD